jgi:predicted lactoylglutathione lyase
MKIFLFLALLLFGTASAQEQHFLSTRVLIPCVDMTRYAAFLEKFGFHTSAQPTMPRESQAEILRLTDGQIFLTLMRVEFKGVHLAMFTDHIDDYLKSVPKEAIANVEHGPGNVVSEVDISAADGVGIFMHPSSANVMPDSILNEKIGTFVEFSIGVPDIDKALAFWKTLGYTVTSRETKPHPAARVSDGHFIVGLHSDPDFNGPALSYAVPNAAVKIAAIKASGIEPIVTLQNKAGVTIGASFQAPEGLIINIYQVP